MSSAAALAAPGFAQERSPTGVAAREFPFPSGPIGMTPAEWSARQARIAATGNVDPGPMRYTFSPLEDDRALLVVKFVQQRDPAPVNYALRAALAREVAEVGYSGARVTDRDCTRIDEDKFTRQCAISLRLKR
ncbi:hypothetical protein ABS767_00135 [Sphingomonas sp. ST-64]|uniref:Uncharacterized protein n=1 Tax=Sphingomonas plantiphila TaxID=3163295 RepID=A0ABW8YGM1_9SPHN